MHSSTSTLSVRITPGAKNTTLERLSDGTWKMRLRARAVEGQANAALLAQLADWLDLPKSRVKIVQGLASRTKVIAVSGLATNEIMNRLLAIADAR